MLKKRKSQPANFFVKFWNGDLSLPMSYWLVGLVFGIVVGFSIGILVFALGMPEVMINILIIPWAIYVSVGIWRSSDKYKGPKFWSGLVKVLVIIGVISTVAQIFLGLSY